MSFDKMKKEELLEVAAVFGVDLPDKPNMQTVLAELKESGVSFEMWEEHQERLEAAKDVELPTREVTEEFTKSTTGDVVLVKMVRDNYRYDTYGYTFRKEHPYHVVPTETAQKIFDTEEGFVMATPREVEEFYS